MEELITNHDRVASHGAVTVEHYLSEINRRDNQKLGDRMLRLTRWITVMTIVMTLATLVNIVLVIVSVAR